MPSGQDGLTTHSVADVDQGTIEARIIEVGRPFTRQQMEAGAIQNGNPHIAKNTQITRWFLAGLIALLLNPVTAAASEFDLMPPSTWQTGDSRDSDNDSIPDWTETQLESGGCSRVTHATKLQLRVATHQQPAPMTREAGASWLSDEDRASAPVV